MYIYIYIYIYMYILRMHYGVLKTKMNSFRKQQQQQPPELVENSLQLLPKLHRGKRTLNSLGLDEESRYKWGPRDWAGFQFRI